VFSCARREDRRFSTRDATGDSKKFRVGILSRPDSRSGRELAMLIGCLFVLCCDGYSSLIQGGIVHRTTKTCCRHRKNTTKTLYSTSDVQCCSILKTSQDHCALMLEAVDIVLGHTMYNATKTVRFSSFEPS
jgi:hypothetical protein